MSAKGRLRPEIVGDVAFDSLLSARLSAVGSSVIWLADGELARPELRSGLALGEAVPAGVKPGGAKDRGKLVEPIEAVSEGGGPTRGGGNGGDGLLPLGASGGIIMCCGSRARRPPGAPMSSKSPAEDGDPGHRLEVGLDAPD